MILGHKRLVMEEDLVLGLASKSQIGPASIDLRLGDSVLVPVKTGEALQLGGQMQYEQHKFSQFEPYIVHPGQFVLATTMERIVLPRNIAGFVQGRSSIGRVGLTTQNAGFIDPGFFGHITLELVNEGPDDIALIPGYRVVQVIFFDVNKNDMAYDGKYNGQIDPTGSRMHLDEEVTCR